MHLSNSASSNLIQLIGDRAHWHPDRTAFTFLKDGETEAGRLTFAEIHQQASGIAQQLQTVLQPMQRATLIFPYEAGLEFITAFIGCLYAQVVAVPCHPPRNQHGWADLSARLVDSESTLVLTTRSLLPKLKHHLEHELNIHQIHNWLTPEDCLKTVQGWQPQVVSPETLAFLQYTSGSTGKPKGVMVTHACLWQNQRMLQAAFEHTEASVGLGWLPLYHDMGLIGNVLQSLYAGLSCVLMSPISFVQKPVRWLNAISRYRATTSGGPNFAYDLLCRYVTEEQRDRLDLSCWDVAFCGAEAVRAATLDQFVAKFAPCGFRREAFYPCYGMAEATLFITGGKKTQPATVLTVDAAGLAQNRVAIGAANPPGEMAPSTPTPALRTQTLVNCGQPWLDTKVAIAHPDTRHPCAEDEIGEIWVAGDGIAQGYWNQAEQTRLTFGVSLTTGEGGFLRTGDLGFLHQGDVFVTGRLHDVMVFWGFNHYPQQIEQVVEACHPAFRVNGCAAFSAAIDGADRLVIVQEIDRQYLHRVTLDEVVEKIRWQVFEAHFVDVGAIALVKPGGLPRTSSGKLQRSECRQQFLDGRLAALEQWQSPEHHDIPSLIRRYLHPLTHLKRYTNPLQARLWRYLQAQRRGS